MKATCCNWCGCSVLSSQGHNHIGDEFIVVGGYDSTPGNGEGALDDMDRYSFILCEFCLDHLFQMFRVPPKVEPELGGGPIQFRPAHVRVKEDAWRHQKVRFLVEEKRRSDLRPSSPHESALVSGALDAQADAEKRLFDALKERDLYRDALGHIAKGNISPSIGFARRVLSGESVADAHESEIKGR